MTYANNSIWVFGRGGPQSKKSQGVLQTRLLSAVIFCMVTALAAVHVVASAGPNSFNVVLIVADDVGYGDISYYTETFQSGTPLVETPAIDALAKRGIWFTNAHSPTPLCAPSRFSLMTGNRFDRSGLPWGNWDTAQGNPIQEADLTLGRVAKAGGLRTGFIGKWHLGADFYQRGSQKVYRGTTIGEDSQAVDFSRWIAGHPESLGFDYDFTLPTGVQGPIYMAFEGGRWSPLAPDSKFIYLTSETAANPKIVRKKPGMADSGWDPSLIAPLLAQKAADFIAESAGEDRFLLTYWSPSVHYPHAPVKQWNGLPVQGTTPAPHLDMVKTFDLEVATIVDALKAAGVYDRTLILLTSDNGGLKDKKSDAVGHRSSGSLRGNKGSEYEGGHRVPFIASWPEVIAGARLSHQMVSGTDIVATIADLLSVEGQPHQARDSWSFAHVLTGKTEVNQRNEMIVPDRNKHAFLSGEWKLIVLLGKEGSVSKPLALFNLKENAAEEESANWVGSAEHQTRVAQLFGRYQELLRSGRTAPLLDGAAAQTSDDQI